MIDNSILHPAAGVQVQPVEDGAVLVDMRSGAVYQLNRVGAEVWSLICSGATAASIRESIAGRYAIPAAQADQDVERLISSLKRAGLLSTESTPGE